MAFLRTLFWIVITVIVVVFAVRNWSAVTINLFGDVQADVKLPVLLLIAFLVGFVPVYVWHRAYRWRHARKLAAVDRTTSAPVPTPSPVVFTGPQNVHAQAEPTPPAAPDPFKAD